jgi:FKBP-type peptidyl-prolyl cis-trans isomerase SlyD
MKIGKDKYVSLIYELKTDGSEELAEKITDENPLSFVFGSGFLLQEFETKVEGLQVGDSFNFIIKAENAYGPKDENAIIELSKEIFIGDGRMNEDALHIGQIIPMMTKSGERVTGIIVEIGITTVKMDFNHPMAGKDLNFNGSVVGVREATPSEIENSMFPGGSCSTCGSGSTCGGTC